MIWGLWSVRTVVIGTAVAAFAVVCVLPVGYMVASVVTGGVSHAFVAAAILLDTRQRSLLYNTALLGTGTALVATAIGVPLGLMLARIPLRGRGILRLALAAPILLPPYVPALAWTYLGSTRGDTARVGWVILSNWTHSLPAAVVILALVFYPLSMLATEVAMRRIDGRLEEAALVVAPPHRVLWHITLPLAAPSIMAAGLVIFVLAISEFGVPGLLRVRVYTTEVFTAFAAFYDFSRATLLAAPLLMLSIAVAGVAAGLLGDRLVTARRRTDTRPASFDAWQRPALAGAVVLFGGAVVAPIAILMREALAARSLAAVLAGSAEAIANSLLLAAAGATAIVCVAALLGYARTRASHRIGRLADIVFLVLFAVPSTIVGVGLIGVWNRQGAFGSLYGTDAMFLLVYLARFVPVAALIIAASTRYVPVSQEEAAAVSGAGWSRTMTRIVLPQIRLGLAAAWMIAFVLAFGELGASILVAPPGEATLPIRIYALIANSPSSQVAALTLFQSAVILAPLAMLAAVASLRERP